MRAFVKAMIAVVLVLAVLLTAFMVLTINGMLPGMKWGSGGMFDNTELINRQVYNSNQFKTLQAEYKSERIELLPSTGDELVLEEYMSSHDDSMLAKVDQSSGALSIRAGERPITVGLSFWNCYIKIYVPADWIGDVTLTNSSGSIKSEDAFQLGSFAAASSSGSVHMHNITADGNISLSASSGSVKADTLVAGGSVSLKSSSGSVHLGSVEAKGDIEASASSGSVHFDAAKAGKVTATTSSGSIKFERLDGEFYLENSSGSVKVQGGTGHGVAKSSSGGINIGLDGVDGDLDLSTTSGSCKLQVPGDTAAKFQAQTTSGSIKVPDEVSLSFNQKGNQAEGSIGQNPRYSLKMQASSGSVRLEFN